MTEGVKRAITRDRPYAVNCYNRAIILASLIEGRFPHSVGEMSAKRTKGDGCVALAKSKILTEGVIAHCELPFLPFVEVKIYK